MHNGKITDIELVEGLVSTGLARKTDFGCQVEEPLVLKALEDVSLLDKSIEAAILSRFQNNTAKLAEYSIAHRITKQKCSVLKWLEKLDATGNLSEETANRLDDFSINHDFVGDYDEFGIIDNCDIFGVDTPLLKNKIVLSRTGLTLPDIMFLCFDENNDSCLISIQIKTWEARLTNSVEEKDEKSFGHAVRSVSRPSFLDGHNQMQMNEKWIKFTTSRNISHLRIIITFAGPTMAQEDAVKRHDKTYPDQPILNIYRKSPEIAAELYGAQVYERLLKELGKLKKQLNFKEPLSIENFRMNLPSNENLMYNKPQ